MEDLCATRHKDQGDDVKSTTENKLLTKNGKQISPFQSVIHWFSKQRLHNMGGCCAAKLRTFCIVSKGNLKNEGNLRVFSLINKENSLRVNSAGTVSIDGIITC